MSKPNKELYQRLRILSCRQLWEEEVPRFEKGSQRERQDNVAVVRAVGVVFSESGSAEEKEKVRQWLQGLLQDPCEKVRRYAMAALPKIGAGQHEEKQLLSLLKTTTLEREKKFLGKALEKIGGAATLEESRERGLSLQTEQKIKASLARDESPSTVRTDRVLSNVGALRIHLRGRRGLEMVVRKEVDAYIARHGKFRLADVRPGLVALVPMAPFSLTDIFALRCFGTVGLALGTVNSSNDRALIDNLAAMITSPLSRRVLETLTEGSIRYRLDFVAEGHKRSLVRQVSNRAYELCDHILNDPRHARWTVAIFPGDKGDWVELCPKLTPDPRFAYRQEDVPAASHPPLAACMAFLAGKVDQDIIWDPFCGSGIELVERALLGGVKTIYGTDLSDEALEITRKNLASAGLEAIEAKLIRSDFRQFPKKEHWLPGAVSLIITNPPMGKRVPVPNLEGLIRDLFYTAESVLKPGGRLVFANPVWIESPSKSLKLEFRHLVDFGGFNCRLVSYRKI